jgi:hypothetical protein
VSQTSGRLRRARALAGDARETLRPIPTSESGQMLAVAADAETTARQAEKRAEKTKDAIKGRQGPNE